MSLAEGQLRGVLSSVNGHYLPAVLTAIESAYPAIVGAALKPHEDGLGVELVPGDTVELIAKDNHSQVGLHHLSLRIPWAAVEAALAARKRAGS